MPIRRSPGAKSLTSTSSYRTSPGSGRSSNELQQGRLTAAARPQHNHRLAVGHPQRQILYGDGRPVAAAPCHGGDGLAQRLANVAEIDPCHCHTSARLALSRRKRAIVNNIVVQLFAEKTSDDAEELHGTVGLGDIVVAAAGGRPLLVALHREGARRDHQCGLEDGIGANLPRRVVTVEDRHLEVHQDKIGVARPWPAPRRPCGLLPRRWASPYPQHCRPKQTRSNKPSPRTHAFLQLLTSVVGTECESFRAAGAGPQLSGKR